MVAATLALIRQEINSPGAAGAPAGLSPEGRGSCGSGAWDCEAAGGVLEVEAQPAAHAAETDRPELACVLVDPFSIHTEDSRELSGVDVAHGQPDATFVDQLGDALGDRLDVGLIERHESTSSIAASSGVPVRDPRPRDGHVVRVALDAEEAASFEHGGGSGCARATEGVEHERVLGRKQPCEPAH